MEGNILILPSISVTIVFIALKTRIMICTQNNCTEIFQFIKKPICNCNFRNELKLTNKQQNDSNSESRVSSCSVCKIYALAYQCRDWQYSWKTEIAYFVAILVFLALLLAKKSTFCSLVRTVKRLLSPPSGSVKRFI